MLRSQLCALAAASLLVAAVIVADGVSRSVNSRYVIIHTDDAGMCESVNAATIDAIELGSVTSASIMACCPGSEAFVRYAAAHPEHDWGVHLMLTSEISRSRWRPILGKDRVPSLVDSDGCFWSDKKSVIKHAKLDDAERELRAQIQFVQTAGVRLSHLDHHMYILYGRPDLMDLYVRLGFEFDLPVRMQWLPEQVNADERSVELNANYIACRNRLLENGMPIFDFIESDNYDIKPGEKRGYYLQQIRKLPAGLSQFVVHCSYDLPKDFPPPHVDRRLADMRVFSSTEVKDEMRRLGLKTTNYTRLREMTPRERKATSVTP